MPEQRALNQFLRSHNALYVALMTTLAVTGCGDKPDGDDVEARAARIVPVAQVSLKAQKAVPGNRTGEQVYRGACAGCHDAGALGSPKFSDAGAWSARLAQGFDTLTDHAIKGIRQMPPRGGAADLTDTEVRRAVAYIANAAGAKFEEPPLAQ